MVNRVLFGKFGNSHVFRVSMPGYEVTSNLTPEQLAFDSDSLETGIVRWSGDGITGEEVLNYSRYYVEYPIPFPAGLVPIVYVFILRNSGYVNSLPSILEFGNDQTQVFNVTESGFEVFVRGSYCPFTYYVMNNRV